MHIFSASALALAALVSAHEYHLHHHTSHLDHLEPPSLNPSVSFSNGLISTDQTFICPSSNRSASQTTCPNGSTLHAFYSPWTSTPHCKHPVTRNSTTEPICAFVSQTFASGRGIALLTTPSRAATILSLPAFTRPRPPKGVNDYSDPPYEERSLPGKGRGLVANKALYSGDRIFASTPILIIDEGIETLEDSDRLALSYEAVRGLPEASQRKFWALGTQDGGHATGGVADPFDDRVDTNSFGLEIAGADCWVIFPEIARLNHDCRPNAAYFFDAATLTHHVHASAASIPPQTELTITYLDPTLPRAQRRAQLRRNWGFACACSACTQPAPFRAASDARLVHVRALAARLADWSAGNGGGVAMALALVELVEMERLHASLTEAYVAVAMRCAAVRDRWGAVRWASKAVRAGLVEAGGRGEEGADARVLSVEPERHWAWGVGEGGGRGGRGEVEREA